jgi:DNA-directed RNA polymerase subunit RPC12/RpoP
MAYLVKESLKSEPRQYALEGILSDYRQKIISSEALVRDEKQDFWYSVTELIGEAPTPEFKFVCPNCKSLIKARKIDVGTEIKCSSCGDETKVPDVKVRQNAIFDSHLLKDANASIRNGVIILFFGIATTVATYMDAFSRGGGGYGIFWGLSVIGAGMIITGVGRRRLHYKKYPKDRK